MARYDLQSEPDLERLKIFRRSLYLGIATVTSSFLVAILLFNFLPFDSISQSFLAQSLRGQYVRYDPGQHWRGLKSVKELVVFGDSYSGGTFAIDGKIVKLNETDDFTRTSTDGANWVDYLMYNRNVSALNLINMAAGGATVDKDLIRPGMPYNSLVSMQEQVHNFLQDNHTLQSTALYAVWMGVNDITAATNETWQHFGTEFVEYADLVDQLYQNKARNFLFLNAPPVEKCPHRHNSDISDSWPGLVAGWNQNVTKMVANLTKTYTDATVFTFDAYKLFDDIMDYPCTFRETCGYKETREYCMMYAFGATSLTFKDPACPYRIDEYFWLNSLHPTTQVHNAVSHAVVDALQIADGIIKES